MRKFLGVLVAASSFASAVEARRVGCETLLPRTEAFSIVVSDSLSLERSDAEGRIAVGGDGRFLHCSVGSNAAASGVEHEYTLLVGGNLRFGEGSVWSGAVGVGGVPTTYAASFSHGVRRIAPRPALDVLRAEIEAASLVASTHRPNGRVFASAERLDLVSDARDLAVFETTAAALAAAREIFVDVPDGATVLVRARDEAVELGRVAFVYRGAVAERTVFHFPNATRVDLERLLVEGSLWAPQARVSFRNGEMNGNLYARSFSGNGRVNQVRFRGCLRP
jgi:choice-of-anchor A domain-containing protein